MIHKLELTDEEADRLVLLLKHVLEASTVELNRTDALAYKVLVKQHIELAEQILVKLNQVLRDGLSRNPQGLQEGVTA